MQKKYFKYILTITILIFSFNMHVSAVEEITMNISEVKGNVCTYNYDGVELTFIEDSNGKIQEKKSTLPSKYTNIYVMDYIDDEFKGSKCPEIHIYQRKYEMYDDILTDLYFFVKGNQSEGIKNDENYTWKQNQEGTLKKVTNTCIFSATSPYTDGGGFGVRVYYDKEKNKVSSKKFESGGITKLSSKFKSNIVYSTETGLDCKATGKNIAIDFCLTGESQVTAYIRTNAETMLKGDSCKASTNPKDGVTVSGDKSKGKVGEIYSLANICKKEKNVMIVVRFIGYLLFIVKILIPIGLIITGIINFSKVVISGNDDDMKKNVQKFGLKIVLAVLVFVLPTIINFIIGLIDGATDGTQDYENCRNCIFDPKNCKIPE